MPRLRDSGGITAKTNTFEEQLAALQELRMQKARLS
jgi:hypothetical protein